MDIPAVAVNSQLTDESSSSGRINLGDVGECRLLKRLGVGGMGQVYKAMHVRLEKLVAVKMLPNYLAHDPAALARFDREIKAVGRVNHPNVVQALDARVIDGTRFLVMEYVDGLDLSKLVRKCGALKIADACELIRQAALGLQAAHEHGLIHRDIKPSNLMLSRQGQLRILDLGLARFRSEPTETDETTSICETVGTAEYIAPEQVVDCHSVDIRADIYSLGCTMFRLLTGQPPFFGPKYPTSVAKLVAHMKEPMPSIRERCGEIPESLAAIFERMVAKNPDDRFATPQEVAEALVGHAAGNNLAELVRQSETEVQATAIAEGFSPSSPNLEKCAGLEAGLRVGQSRPSPLDLYDPARQGAHLPRRMFTRRTWAAAATVVSVFFLAVLASLGYWLTKAQASHRQDKDSPIEANVALLSKSGLSERDRAHNIDQGQHLTSMVTAKQESNSRDLIRGFYPPPPPFARLPFGPLRPPPPPRRLGPLGRPLPPRPPPIWWAQFSRSPDSTCDTNGQPDKGKAR